MPEKKLTYYVHWTLRSRTDPNRFTKHIYAGLTREEADNQQRKCSIMGIDFLDEWDTKVEIYAEEEE